MNKKLNQKPPKPPKPPKWTSPTSEAWFWVHILAPIGTYGAAVFVRFTGYLLGGITNFNMWIILNTSELALISALISFFIRQNLVNQERHLNNIDKQHEAMIERTKWTAIGVFALIVFIIIELAKILFYEINLSQTEVGLRILEGFVFVLIIFIGWYAMKTQDSFKLKVKG